MDEVVTKNILVIALVRGVVETLRLKMQKVSNGLDMDQMVFYVLPVLMMQKYVLKFVQ